MKNLPALKTALAIALGILLARTLNFSWTILGSFFGGMIVLGISALKFRNKLYWQAGLLFCLILLGSIRYKQFREYPHNHVIHFIEPNHLIKMKGILVKDPVPKENRIQYIIQVNRITTRLDSFNVCGNILITSRDTSLNLHYGDEIVCHGYLVFPKGRRNPGGFNYKEYLLHKNIIAIFRLHPLSVIEKTENTGGHPFYRIFIYPLRSHVRNLLLKGTEAQKGELICALILGEKSGLSPEIKETFAKAGIAHLLAVSGLHVGFVLLIFSTGFGFLRLPEIPKYILTAMALLFYMIFTESNPPVVRATVMAITWLFGNIMGKRSNPLNLLGMAALILLLVKPSSLFDPGFQLSFIAVFSIMIISKPLIQTRGIQNLKRYLYKSPLGSGLFIMLILSVSVQIGTLPILANYFNRISLLSFVFNLLAIPLTGLIVALGFTTILLGSMHPFLAEVYGECNSLFLGFLMQSSEWITQFKWASIHVGTPSWTACLLYYTTLLLFLSWGKISKKYLIMGWLIFLNLFIWHIAITCEAGNLTCIQLDVSQGDAAVIHLPRGKTLLLDGGPCDENRDAGKTIIAPYLHRKGIRTLDAVILSHPHNDHVGGLNYILREFAVKKIWTAGTPANSVLYSEFNQTIRDKHIPVDTITAPAIISTFPGVEIQILSPTKIQKTNVDNLNNQSIVMQIRYGSASMLFTGDAEKESEYQMMERGNLPVSQILKVGHHGSSTSSSRDFLRSVHPELAVISVGENNRFGLPSQKTLASLDSLKIPCLRTDRDNGIVLKSYRGSRFQIINWH